MSVNNGQPANQDTFNNAFASKTADNTVTGKLDLNNAAAESGTQVTNAQREHNSVASYVGKAINALKDILPSWTSTAVGTPTDDLTQRAEALTVQVGTNIADISLKEDAANKGIANGYAELDGDGKVPSSQLTISALQYLGTYDATTNTPTLIDGTGDAGDLYRTTVAGTQDFGSGNITFAVGDKVVYNPGGTWEKWDTDDSDKALQDLSNLTAPTAINETFTFATTGGMATVDDATADAVPTDDINIVTGDKTAGTGDSGSVTIETGTSAGGLRGDILLNSDALEISGDVGIGTTPVTNVPLSIKASVQANNGIMTWQDSQGNDTWEWGVYDNGYLSLIKNGLTVRSFFIDATGRVGIGNSPTTGRFAVAYPQDTLQVEIKGDVSQTAALVNFNDGSNNVLSSVKADGSSEWPQIDVTGEGELRLQDATGGEYIGLKAPSTVTSSTTLTLPDGDGTLNQVLTTDGTGNLSWSTPSTGGDLWSDPVDADIIPTGADNTYDLGDSTDGFGTTFTNSLNVGKNGGGAIGLQNNGGSGSVTGFITGATGSIPSGVSANVRYRLVYPSARMAFAGDSNATADAVATGDLHIETGNKTAGTGDSGSIVIYTGTSAGGNRGAIKFADGSEGTVGHVWTQTNADGSGEWQAGAGGGADVNLSNLANTVAIPDGVDILPANGNQVDLGSFNKYFDRTYTEDLFLSTGSNQGQLKGATFGFPSGASVGVSFLGLTTNSVGLATASQSVDSTNSSEIRIETGNATGLTSDSGNFVIQTGTATQNRGTLVIKDGSEGTIGHVWTSTGTGGEGNWAAAGGGGGDAWSDPIDSNITTDGGSYNLADTTNRINFGFFNFVTAGSGPSFGASLIGSAETPSGVTATGALRGEASSSALAIFTVDEAASNDVLIETGEGVTTTSGDIKLSPGPANTTRGTINFVDGSEGTIGHVWTSTGVNGEGNWAAGGGVAADSIGSTEILLDNNTWLRWKNDPAGTSENVLRINPQEQLELGVNIFQFTPQQTGGADLGLASKRWNQIYCNGINVNGDILPATSASRDLGSANFRYAEVHATDGYIRNIQPTTAGSTTLNIRTAANTTTGPIVIKSGDGSAGNSGSVTIQTGTATATRGQINLNSDIINMTQATTTQVVWENGVTGSRPVSPVTGQRYFDTTIGLPIWYDGTNWIDAAGTTV